LTAEWVTERSADEVVAVLARAKVGCSKVYTAADALADEHWRARADFIDYEDQTVGRPVTALGIVPKFARTPGQVWRGAPALGQDTDTILDQLVGLSPDPIADLRQQGHI